MIQNEVKKSFFDVWRDGLVDMQMLGKRGMAANNGFSDFANTVEGKCR